MILVTSAVPGLITLIIRLGSPESPAWLARKGRTQEALAIIHKHLGTRYSLPQADAEVPSASWFRLFSKELRYNTFVSGVFFACQVLPFFAITIFLPMVLTALNIENPHASGVMYNVVTMVGVLFGTWLIDKVSRRAYLLGTFYGAAVILTVMTLWHNMPGAIALVFLAGFSLVLAMSIVLEFLYPPDANSRRSRPGIPRDPGR